jgi:hypothetical protein
MQKVKWKRSTKLIILKFSSMKWNMFYNFKVKCHRPLIVCLEVPNVYSPIAVVQIDSYSKVNKIHAAHFWVCMVAIVGAFIDCQIRSDFRMDAPTLYNLTSHNILEPTMGVTFFNNDFKSDSTRLFPSIVLVITS